MGSEDEFNFERELKEYSEGGMVKELELDVISEGVSANLTVTTLEDIVFQIKWTVENGLQIEKVDGQTAS